MRDPYNARVKNPALSTAPDPLIESTVQAEYLNREVEKRSGGRIALSFAIAAADIAASAALIWRTVAWPVENEQHSSLVYLRAGLDILLGVWGLVYLAWVIRPRVPALRTLILRANTHASLLIACWSAAVGAADLFAGAGPIVVVCGLAVASLYGWDHPFVTSLTAALSGLLCAGSSLAASQIQGVASDLESLAFVAVSVCISAGISFTVRSYVVPGRELLRTLETENRQLWDLSFRDALTGLYNRRFAQEAGHNLFQRAKRYHEQFYVLMIDVDRFKRINDELTHARGDDVLKAIAATIQSCLRSSDSVSRYGGEEFLVYLVQADAQIAQFVANRIRESIESTAFAGVPWQVTISVGMAGIRDDDSLETLIERADRFLYAAKRSGRNRISGF